ncbi:maleylpyruvate isomerase family mycothiol-dependent enzyme [Nocardiopsis sp. CC223A]|uniref:maleylpyruvate isomerase family mycothiol-dependent enzyme n=1 Tax=Nocardiopsis sp. CC223A TaxID=3044051 RepID=UPI0027955831|nr:maleylpyruvate isomerase family mycothiol-dependent enzyme [Nocardiopsis sp. CC223A]
MDRDDSWRVIERERLALADLLEGLGEEQWETRSLCEGWRVRDVAGHVALTPRLTSLPRVVGELVRAGGSYDRMVRDVSIRHARRPGADLVGELREYAASRDLVVLTDHENILFDTLVHAQDIAVPLGIDHPAPVDAARAGADRVWSMGWPFHARKRLAGAHLVATDTDWEVGSGERVEGPVLAFLLLLTGRPAMLDRLSGPGIATLIRAVNT